MPATYEPIATTTLSADAQTFTFSSIPATYTDLRLVMFALKKSAAGNGAIQTRINGDTATNYSWVQLRGNGSSPSTSNAPNQNSFDFRNTLLDSTNPKFYTIDYFSYRSSVFKTVLADSAEDSNGGSGAGFVEKTVGLYRSTSAITSITIFDAFSGTSLGIGSTFTLYGIKNA